MALGALILPDALTLPRAARAQVGATLPEITVSPPRERPPVRRATPAARPARATPSPPVSEPEPAPSPPRPRVSASAPSPPSTPAPAPQIPAFQVVAPTPVTGLGFDRDKVPAMVQTLAAEDFSRVYSPNVTRTLEQRVPGVFISDVQGNEFTSDLRYRGFAASPLQGTPQGLAVYMQGVRVNEAFGDTVNWDLIPTIAIGRADVWTNNPAFGLNALGGAISLQMKDGFTYRGTEFDTSGGSYGRLGGWLQYGVRNGEWATYLAAQGVTDDGWRYQSPSRIARFYGDLGWKGTDAEVHLVASTADNFFGVIGPTPIELLNNDYRSIFTWPQTTRNQAELLALNGRYSITDHWTVQSNLYLRKFDQAHVDGNGAEVERCSGMVGNPLFNTLCLENDGFSNQPQANFQIFTGRQFTDFIQKNRPAFRQLEAADAPGDSARECPLLVAEQFAFHKTGGQRRTVDLDQGFVFPRAIGVNSASNQFLARAGLTRDEDSGVRDGHAANIFQNGGERGAVAHNFIEIVDGFDFLLKVQILLT